MNFNKEKFNSLVSVIGYLANKFKRKDLAKAIILCDPNIPDSDESEGGVGKSLFAKILSYVCNQTVVDGRNFQRNNKFNLNHLDESTDVCLINDFADSDFSNFYNYITDDLQIRQLYKGTRVISFDDAPKFIFTMNKVLTGTGFSDTRRKIEIELSNYYNQDHKPSDDFGILFEWDEDEWARFDAFIGKCIRLFYKNGLVECKPEHLDYKRLQSATSPEFAAYAKHYIKSDTLYWMDSIFLDYSQKSDEILTTHYKTKYLNALAKFTKTKKYDEYLKSQGNRRWVVFSSEKSKNLAYWKKTLEYQKLLLSELTRPSHVQEKSHNSIKQTIVPS